MLADSKITIVPRGLEDEHSREVGDWLDRNDRPVLLNSAGLRTSKDDPGKESQPHERKRLVSAKAVYALVFYLVLPVLVIYVIMNTYEDLSKERYEHMLWAIVPFSILMVIISQASIRHPKGSWHRLAYNMAYVVVSMLWLFAFLGWSTVITQNWGPYEFSIHLERYVALIIGVTVFSCFYYYLEWYVYNAWPPEDPMPEPKKMEKAKHLSG